MDGKQPDKDTLLFAYILDGSGGGRNVGWDEINAWTPADGLLWIHLDAKSEATKNWLVDESGLDEIACEMLLAGEVRPRTVLNKEGSVIILRGVNLNPGADPEDMVSIRVWIDQHRVITTLRRKVMSIEDLCKAIRKGQGPTSLGEFVTELADRLVERMADVIETIDENVSKVEETVMSGEPSELRELIGSNRRQAISLRRFLTPQMEALSRLQTERIPSLKDVDRVRLREITDRTTHYIESLDVSRELAAMAQEGLHSRLSEQLERRMYTLAIITAIFLPLTFITGLLGINVAGIPGANSSWGFIGVSSVLILILSGQLWLLRKKKWF